jgi:hypothetical protein
MPWETAFLLPDPIDHLSDRETSGGDLAMPEWLDRALVGILVALAVLFVIGSGIGSQKGNLRTRSEAWSFIRTRSPIAASRPMDSPAVQYRSGLAGGLARIYARETALSKVYDRRIVLKPTLS